MLELGMKIVVQKGKRNKSVTCCNRHHTFHFSLQWKWYTNNCNRCQVSLDSPTKSRAHNSVKLPIPSFVCNILSLPAPWLIASIPLVKKVLMHKAAIAFLTVNVLGPFPRLAAHKFCLYLQSTFCPCSGSLGWQQSLDTTTFPIDSCTSMKGMHSPLMNLTNCVLP